MTDTTIDRTPRGLTLALTTGSALILGLELGARFDHPARWVLHALALTALAILAVIVAAHNGRPGTDRKEN